MTKQQSKYVHALPPQQQHDSNIEQLILDIKRFMLGITNLQAKITVTQTVNAPGDYSLSEIEQNANFIPSQIAKLLTDKTLLQTFETADLIFNAAAPTPAKTAVIGLAGAYVTFMSTAMLTLSTVTTTKNFKEKLNLYKACALIMFNALNYAKLMINNKSKAMRNSHKDFEAIVHNFSRLHKNGDLNNLLDAIKAIPGNNVEIKNLIRHSRAFFESATDAFDKYTTKDTVFVKKFAELIKEAISHFYHIFSWIAAEIKPQQSATKP